MQFTSTQYFTSVYPFDDLVAFLTRHGDELCRREFAVEGDFYKRYVRARDAADLKRQVLAVPGLKSFHVGAVHDAPVAKRTVLKTLPTPTPPPPEHLHMAPLYDHDSARLVESFGTMRVHRIEREKNAEPSVPVRCELRFDVDLTDYDTLMLTTPAGDVDVEACDRAWPVCAAGLVILQTLLTNAFGYQEYISVFSGRRGAHLYVCDESAMGLSDQARTAIVEFLDHTLTKDKKRGTSSLRSFMVSNKLQDYVRSVFETELVSKMGMLDSIDNRLAFVERLDLDSLDLMDVVDKASGIEAWKYLQSKLASAPCAWMRERLDETVLAYVWPRIDANVTNHTNHLLKAPLVAHPKSGRVAVPMRVADCMAFQPAKAPTLSVFDDAAFKNSLAFLKPSSAMPAQPRPKSQKRRRSRSRTPHHHNHNHNHNHNRSEGAEGAEDLVDVEDLVPAGPLA